MTDIEAGVGICQLRKLDNFVRRRKDIFDYYKNMLKDIDNVITHHYDKSIISPSFYRFVLKVPNEIRFNLLDSMFKKGIACTIGVPKPLHRLLCLDNNNYIGSENLYNEVLSLHIYPSLKNNDIKYVMNELIASIKDLK